MTVVCVLYILIVPEGLRLDYNISICIAIVLALFLSGIFLRNVYKEGIGAKLIHSNND